jgi:hypothetical protein
MLGALRLRGYAVQACLGADGPIACKNIIASTTCKDLNNPSDWFPSISPFGFIASLFNKPCCTLTKILNVFFPSISPDRLLPITTPNR